MLIGFTVEGFQDWHPAAITAAMRRLGVNFIEYNIRLFNSLDQVLPQLRAMRTAFHLPIIEEEGWDFSSSERQQQIEASIALLLQHHRALSLTHFIAHPPAAGASSGIPPARLDTLFANLARLPRPLYFENIPELSPEAFRAFLKEAQERLGAKYAGMCFDAAHFQISGLDPVAQFLAFRDQIGAVHLSDCIGREDSHLPFDSGGDLPIRPLLRAMRRSGYRGSITLEIRPDPAGDLASYIRSYTLLLRSFTPARFLSTRLRLLAAERLMINRN
ncbi:MAG TPA: TIM barrel protein [bacterium]|nr:TIM barrel protein [bacterium]HPR86914.1 TIM barrel protein [bacterium]